MRLFTFAVLTAVLACDVPAAPPDATAEVETTQAAVQSEFLASGHFRVVTVPPDGADVDALLLASTGAIVHYGGIQIAGFRPNNASCGATFISPHYAVTAAHCVANTVDNLFTDAGEFLVDQIDVSGVDPVWIGRKAQVTGTWPNWQAGHSGAPPPGYERTRLHCRVSCAGSPPFTACTPSTVGTDFALIECPARASDFWVIAGNVAPKVGDPVQAFWYHEILDLPITAGAGEGWDRYGGFANLNGVNGVYDDNFHYTFTHLLWPLISDRAADGAAARVTSASPTGPTGTNLFGCHGTSGSGIFARGSTVLYGPVATGSFGGLCGRGMATNNMLKTNDVQRLPRVADDRNGIYVAGF